jgi:hypothetical protein
MRFAGIVYSRSSAGAAGPPGEKAILELNPERLERIVEATGWCNLEPGTLNLRVEDSVVTDLESQTPLFVEDAATIRYPRGFERIPIKRKGYLYFLAVAQSNTLSRPVLVRRAVNPVPRCVELFAEQNLRASLSLRDGNTVEIDLEDRLLEEMRDAWAEEERFFSNAGKSERERWVVSEFLTQIGVAFEPAEITSPEQAHSTDVNFRQARFQVKEITDPTSPRHREVKEIHQRVKNAKTLKDVVGPAVAYDTPVPLDGGALIYERIAQTSQEVRYRPSKSDTDLLFYVTQPRASAAQWWTQDWSNLRQFGWRSISCLTSKQSRVLYANDSAPNFLRAAASS